MKNKILFIIVLGFLFAMSGCEDLDVKNPNNPQSEDVLSDPSNLQNLAGSVFLNWYNANVGYYEQPSFMMGVAADASSASWGNFGMRDAGREPRVPWNNDPSYSNALMTESYYSNIYAILSTSNDVLKGMQDTSITMDNPTMVKAVAKFGQGIALGYISLVFDRGFIVKEDDDLGQDFELKPYMEVRDAALASLDEAISLCNSGSFTLPESWINSPNPINSERLGNLANFMAAKIMLSSPRTKTENENLDWSKILSYAQNGLEQDYKIIADNNFSTWSAMYIYYGTNPGWGRVDMRIVDMLDNQGTIPPVWPSQYKGDHTNFPNAGKIQSNDARVDSDFQYMESQVFNANRGYYFFSTYRYSRFDPLRESGWPGQGEFSLYRKAENDYMIAEAMVRANGNISGARNILNNSARDLRGELPTPSGLNKEQMLDVIEYERNIELFSNNLGIQYFDMRRMGQLQKGTPLHYPLPGSELETLQMENYTFGGESNAGSEGTAGDGWKTDYENNYGGSGPYYDYNW